MGEQEQKKKQKKTTSSARKTKPAYALDDSKLNVLLLGTSGSGKSTLINSIIPNANAPTGKGLAVTKSITPYKDSEHSLVLIDTVGYEFSASKQKQVKAEIKKWTKAGIKRQDASKYIHMIWFCIDSQSGRIFYEVLDDIRSVVKLWKGIPVIVVFTKSIGNESEDLDNKRVFLEVLSSYKYKDDLNINESNIISVLAKDYPTCAGTAPAKGLDKLVERTLELSPEAKAAATKAVRNLTYDLKFKEATTAVALYSAGAAVVGVVPLDFSDSLLLNPLQKDLVYKVNKIYGVDKPSAQQISEAFINNNICATVAKELIKALKKMPVLIPVASILNAIVASTITYVVGEATVLLYDGIQRGTITINDDGQLDNILDNIIKQHMPSLLSAIKDAVGDKHVELSDIPGIILTIAKNLIDQRNEHKPSRRRKRQEA